MADMTTIASFSVPKDSTIIGNICGYDHSPIQAGESAVYCPVCQTPHHAICWASNGNKCTLMGCGGSGTIDGSISPIWPPPPSPPPPLGRPFNWLAAVAWGLAVIVLAFVLFRLIAGANEPSEPGVVVVVDEMTPTAAGGVAEATSDASTTDSFTEGTAADPNVAATAATVTSTQEPSKTSSRTPTPTYTPRPTATLPSIASRTSSPDGALLVSIPAGTFTMGITDEQEAYLLNLCRECTANHFSGSKPAHDVFLDTFWIYQTEVTNRMYTICVHEGACIPPAVENSNSRSSYWGNPTYDNYPVVYVSWFAAAQYCRWSGGRLPTQAEWEKAARGTDGRLFPWGNAAPTQSLANVNQRDGDTVATGSYPQGASPFDILDMAGNVWEWTADWFDPAYYLVSPLENPAGPATSPDNLRVGKGGSWFWHGVFASSAYHDWWEPANIGSGVGFRCVDDSEN